MTAATIPRPPRTSPDVATFSSVDTEQVVQLGADLVVAGGLGFTPADAITKLRSLKIPVLVIYAPSVDGVLKDIELIGAAVGATDEAKTMTDGMSTQLKAISDAAAAKATSAGPKPRVYYEIGYTDATGQIYAPADKSFLAEMVTLAGAEPITTGDPNTYEIPLEKLIQRDPQVIIIGVNPFYSPAPRLAREPSRLEGHDRDQGRQFAPSTTPRSPVRARGWRSACARSRSGSGPTSSSRRRRRRPANRVSPGPAPRDRNGRHRRPPPWAPGHRHVAAVLALGVTLVVGVGLGSVRIGPADSIGVILWRAFGIDLGRTWTPATEAIVWDLRMPRVLTAMLVGAALAVAGATFQGLIRNPLADPYVLGTASGAALGAAIAVVIPVHFVIVEFGLLHGLAFAFALITAFVVVKLGGGGPAGSPGCC